MKVYTVQYDVSLALIGEGIARNCFGSFHTKREAQAWLDAQEGLVDKNPVIKETTRDARS